MTANCPVCKKGSPLFFRAKDFNRNITLDTFDYYRCPWCKLIFLSPIPDDLGKYYPDDYYRIPSSIEDLAKAAESELYKIEIVKRFASGGRLLEIGPAYGSFVYLAKRAGFDAEAIERDSNCCRFIYETMRVKVIQGDDVSEALEGMEEYDVITLWQVIEHLADPWKTLEAISKKLKPGGIVVIATPNPKAFQFCLLRRFWPHVDAPRHLSLIPLSLLTKQMLSLGLKSVWSTSSDKGTLECNTFGWVYFFLHLTNLHMIKILSGIIGRKVSIMLRPIERMNDRGSAYTVVFQKERW